MYFGEATTTLDEKGRITVPRRFRDTMNVLGHAVWYLTRGFDGCIFLFPHEEWVKIRDGARQHSWMNGGALDFKRLLFSSVAEAKPDGQGRLPIAPHLREMAGLEKEVVIIGVGDHCEVWDKERWRAFQEKKAAEYKDMASRLFGEEAAPGEAAPDAERVG